MVSVSIVNIIEAEQVEMCSVTTATGKDRGFIVSPNYPSPYPPSRNCTLTVVAPPAGRITIHVIDLYLAYGAEEKCVDRLVRLRYLSVNLERFFLIRYQFYQRTVEQFKFMIDIYIYFSVEGDVDKG